MLKKETWPAINSPKITLIRGIARRKPIDTLRLIEANPQPPPKTQTKDSWDDRLIPLDLGAYSPEIEKWRKIYKDLIHQTREDKNPDMEEAARKSYESRHGNMVEDAEKMKVPNLKALAGRLSAKNMNIWEAHLIGVVCLYGIRLAPSENETEQLLDLYGIAFMRKAHYMSRGNPLHAYGIRVELEKLLKKQSKTKTETERKFKASNLEHFYHNEGKEKLTAPYYYARVQEWAYEYVGQIMNYQKVKYEEQIKKGKTDIDNEIFELWRKDASDLQRRCEGEHKEHVRVMMLERKHRTPYFKYMFEQNPHASAYFLYRNLALPALRNPWGGEKMTEKNRDELVAFEILKEAYKRASDNPSDLKNYKGFIAFVTMVEFANKWMNLRDENGQKLVATAKVKKSLSLILEAAFLNWMRRANPVPSIDKPLYGPSKEGDPLDEIPR